MLVDIRQVRVERKRASVVVDGFVEPFGIELQSTQLEMHDP